MKALKLFTLILGITLIGVSCDVMDTEEERSFYKGGEWVNFSSQTANVSEANEADGIDITLVRSSADEALTVTLAVESENLDTGEDASSDFSVNPSSLEVTFDAGEYETDITVLPVNNNAADGDKLVTISIASVSNSDINIGYEGPDALNSSVDLTIIDDDCPLDFEGWIGTYSVQEVFTAGTNEGLSLAAAFGETYQVELAQDPDDPSGFTYLITNSDGANQFFVDGTTMNFNSCGGTVTINDGAPFNLALFANMNVESAVFVEADFEITVSGTLGNFGAYEFVLTKQ